MQRAGHAQTSLFLIIGRGFYSAIKGGKMAANSALRREGITCGLEIRYVHEVTP